MCVEPTCQRETKVACETNKTPKILKLNSTWIFFNKKEKEMQRNVTNYLHTLEISSLTLSVTLSQVMMHAM